MQATFQSAVQDEAALRAALQQADIVPSLLVLTHLTGDFDLLEQAAPYIAGGWNYQESVPQALRETAQEQLIRVLKDYAGRDRPLPALPPHDVLQRMMSASVGSNVPSEYVPMFVEELRLGERDTRAFQGDATPSYDARETLQVVIVGAGIAGICAGVRLKQAGIPFVILERNAKPGGTWYENHYPGCGVDTPNHFYSFSFCPNENWSRYFCSQDEIWAYLNAVVDKFGLDEHIQYGVEVNGARYNEERAVWEVEKQNADGQEDLVCNCLITAVGHNIPSTPSITGLENFGGQVVHTARWDHTVELAGKRVAVIGTGASGMQVGPAVVDSVEKLTVFQRTPHWAMGNPNYHKAVSEGQLWALNNIPLFGQWHRFLIFWAASDMVHEHLHVDPTWDQPALSLNAQNHKLRETIIEYMRKELDGDEELLRKCTPSYPPYGKRLLRDNHWFRMLRKPNVELVTDAISHISHDGIVTKSGDEHPADVLVMATGFSAAKLLWPMEIVGTHGRSIRSIWGDDDPRAYKGMSVPGFPNLFVLAGPNTALSHGGSAVFQIECQVAYTLRAIQAMIENGYASIEVRADIHDAYNNQIDQMHQGMVWMHPGVTSWYKNKNNRVTMTSPWRLVDFWRITREFDETEYICAQPARTQSAQQARQANCVMEA